MNMPIHTDMWVKQSYTINSATKAFIVEKMELAGGGQKIVGPIQTPLFILMVCVKGHLLKNEVQGTFYEMGFG